VTVVVGTVGVLTTDVGLVVQSWDAWIAAATGLPEEDARGRPLGELYPDLATRGLLDRVQRVATSGEVAVLASAFHGYLLPCPPRSRTTHFTRMQQHVIVAPLRSDDAIVGIVVTIEDVTARRDREQELARQLESTDESVRLQAVRALAEADSAQPLVAALGDPSWRVRRAASEGLAHERDDAAIDALVAAVRERNRDAGVLNAALTALVNTDRDVLPSLLPLLDADDADVRTYAALALGLIRDRRAVPALAKALADADDNVRFHAVEALGRIGARGAALPVAAIAESRDFTVAFAALDTLARIGEPSVAPRLVPLLDDPLLQVAAVDALGALGAGDVVGPLVRLLEQPDAPVGPIAVALARLDARQRAESDDGAASLVAGAIGATISATGVDALVQAMGSATDEEARCIARVLGWLDGEGVDDALVCALARPAVRETASDALAARGRRAVAPLIALVAAGSDDEEQDDDVREARRAAAATLGRLGAASAVPVLIPMLEDQPEAAIVAAGALGQIGDARAFEPLLAQLDRSNAAIRQVAVSALNSLGHAELASRLPRLIDDASPRVRESAARVGGYLGDAALLDGMLALSADADESVRRAAVEQLPRFDDPRARSALAHALREGTAGVRAAAARGLAHADPATARELLVAATSDTDPWVRYYAARSLARVGGGEAVARLRDLALHDPVPPVRIAGVEGLGEVGAAEDLASLRAMTGDLDPAVAVPALIALGGTHDLESLDALLATLAHSDRGRRIAALTGLARRAEPTAIEAVASAARRATDPEERDVALQALAAIDDERAVAALVDIAREPAQCAAVVDTLATLAPARVGWLRPALSDPDVSVRCAVIEALGRMRHPLASTMLSDAVQDRDPAARTAAEHALARHDLRASAD
jgi:HEAT repeat protein